MIVYRGDAHRKAFGAGFLTPESDLKGMHPDMQWADLQALFGTF